MSLSVGGIYDGNLWSLTPPPPFPLSFLRLVSGRRERDLLQVPHFFVGTLQPL